MKGHTMSSANVQCTLTTRSINVLNTMKLTIWVRLDCRLWVTVCCGNPLPLSFGYQAFSFQLQIVCSVELTSDGLASRMRRFRPDMGIPIISAPMEPKLSKHRPIYI